MQVGVISDIHGNNYALNAVLEDMPYVDTIVSLGDVVGYGPQPRMTADTIKSVASVSLRGNHETYLENPDHAAGNKGAHEGIKHARSELTDELFEWLTSRPYRDVVADELGLAHGSPDPDNPFGYVKSSNITELIPLLMEQPYTVQAVGHTHLPFKQDLRKFEEEAGVVFNPGSVGQPRDGDPRAGYAVVDIDELPDNPVEAITLHRTPYDVDRAVQAINSIGLPEENGQRLETGSFPQQRTRRNNSPFQ